MLRTPIHVAQSIFFKWGLCSNLISWETFPVVQWLRLCTSNGERTISTLGWETKIPHGTGVSKKKKSLISPLRAFLAIWSKEKSLYLSLLFLVMSFLIELPIRIYVYSLSPYQNISTMSVYSLLYSKWQQCLANVCFK